MNFSAKDLCSKSAMQIKYLRDNPNKRTVTQNMLNGSEFQKSIFHSNSKALYSEMVGCYTTFDNEIKIYFSNDIITNKSIIEVKYVSGNYEDWFLENSILQCAFYKSLIMMGCTSLKTASFVNEPKKMIKISRDIDYYLKFGDRIFKIEVIHPEGIFGFFLCKAKHTMNYDDAKKFDEMYKRKEFNTLSKFFNYYECKTTY